jgi:hypothetical protein
MMARLHKNAVGADLGKNASQFGGTAALRPQTENRRAGTVTATHRQGGKSSGDNLR